MSDTSSFLALKGFAGVPEITPDALKLKRAALALSAAIQKVTSDPEQMLAVHALRELKNIRTGIEATRKAVKAPVLELGKQIDNLASDFIEEVNKEEMRVKGHVNHFQRKQLELKAEEERRLEREAVEAQKLKDQAERLRKEAELSGRADLIETAVNMEAQALDATMSAELSQSLAIAKPKGLIVKNRLNFQVMDAMIFAQAYPEFWNWNEETETLKLKRRDILEELNKEKGRFHLSTFPEELPDQKDSRIVKPLGLRIFEEMRSHVR